MDYAIFGLRVGSAEHVQNTVREYLGRDYTPQSVRLAVKIPVSNQGWPDNAAGTVLRVDEKGVLVGAEEPEGVPPLLVPWSNIGYLAEGLEPV